MLRRKFIKAAFLAFGSSFFIRAVPAVGNYQDFTVVPGRRKRILPFNGHPRSGCSTRPEVIDLLEGGILNMPG